MAPKKSAVLVGIRTYPNIPAKYGAELAGCHNDVAALQDVLTARGFDDVHVLVDLMDEGCDCRYCTSGKAFPSPTREKIRAAVDDLAKNAAAEDVVVFFYSGHGSEYDGRGLFAGQRFQTIVPHDSGRGGPPNRDIVDREIESWIRLLNQKTPYVTLIFDCCHSGGLSSLRGDESGGRRVKPDERTPEEMSDGGKIDERLLAAIAETKDVAEESGHYGGDEPARSPSGWVWRPGRSAVVLSACAAKELSSETLFEGKRNGLFTLQLTRTLAADTAAGTTWSDVFPKVAEKVVAENIAQHPRREGNSPVFAPGLLDPASVDPPDVIELKKYAVVVGIDYQSEKPGAEKRFTPLRTPRIDAAEVARVLTEVQGYELVGFKSAGKPLLNEDATRENIHEALRRLTRLKVKMSRETAVVIYFACHGVLRNRNDGGFEGYLVPWDARRDDPATWLPMKDLRDQLVDGISDPQRLKAMGVEKVLPRLRSRHLLLILDCCFGGAASFEFFRGGGMPERPIYYSEYKRFVEGPAWQLLTSTSYDQQALDRDPKDPSRKHSPFAEALITGLRTDAADTFLQSGRPDHIVTATELHQYVDGRLRESGVDVQTPELMPIRPIRGQFIFHVPGFVPSPMPDPTLDPARNPWRSPKPDTLDPDVDPLFFGRKRATIGLLGAYLGSTRLAVVGVSGCGKTSLLHFGLLPILKDPAAGRKDVRDWAGTLGLGHLLISAEDLAEVRSWAKEEGLEDLLDDPQTLAGRVKGWTLKVGLKRHDAAEDRERSQMKRLGLDHPDEQEGVSWADRLDLVTLAEAPASLAERLRDWLRVGLVDFLAAPQEDLAGLVGEWKLVASPEEAGTAGAAHALALARSEESLDESWARYRVPAPERDELREAVLGPAAARVLFFEPETIVDDLVEDVAETPAPLALLSLAFSETFVAAWNRRKNDDRQITAEDVYAIGGNAQGLLARRSEELLEGLLREDPDHEGRVRRLFLRLVEVPEELPDHDDDAGWSGRHVSYAELEIKGADDSSAPMATVLHRYVDARILTTDGDHVELGHVGLIEAWKRFCGWILDAGVDELRRLRSTWQRATAWERSGRDPRKLWDEDREALQSLLRSEELNRLEREFVEMSEISRREKLVYRLEEEADREPEENWSRGALLAAEAARVALLTRKELGDDRCLPIAEGALREALALTPLSVPLGGLRPIAGVAFDDDVRRLVVETDRERLVWDLADLSRPPKREARGAGGDGGEPPGPTPAAAVRVRSRRGFVAEAGLDEAVRLSPPLYSLVPDALRDFFRRPTELLGPLERTARLAFAHPETEKRRDEDEDGDWLASTALRGPGGAEVRLWRIRGTSLDDKLDGLPKLLGLFPKARPDEMALFSDAWLPSEPTVLVVPPDARPTALAFLENGRLLATSPGRKALVWDLAAPWALPERTSSKEPSPHSSGPPTSAVHGSDLTASFDERGRVTFLEGARRIEAPPSGPPCRVTAAAFHGAGDRLAVGDERGCVVQWFRRCEPPAHRTAGEDPPWVPVLLGPGRGRAAGVTALAFDGDGRRLAVLRRSLTEPPRSFLDVYRVRIEDLEVLARGHAGRGLLPVELPPEVWRDLFGEEGDRGTDPLAAGDESHPQDRRPSAAYLEALGLQPKV